MKTNHIVFFLIIIFVALNMEVKAQGSGYVTLKGRQFYDQQGIPFYPKVMNYTLNHVFEIANPSNTFISPLAAYGANDDDYDYGNQTSCTNQFKDQLSTCLAYGFNAIRIGWVAPVYVIDSYLEYKSSYGTNDLKENIYDNDLFNTPPDLHYTGYCYRTIGYGNMWKDNYVKLTQVTLPGQTSGSYKNDPVTINYLQKIKLNVLDQCDTKGVKVIYLTDGKWRNSVDVDRYRDMLETIADQFKDSKSLMAYDLSNEPELKKDLNIAAPLTKQKVCDYTTQWYNALTSNDPNHLVTIGSGSSLGYWDPAFMKVDFISPHIYPYPMNYENRGGRYSRTDAYERWRASIYWLSLYSPLPWLIGETSFSALNDITGTTCPANCSTYTVPPYTFGSEEEQRQFAQNAQKDVWDYGGSGISWWEYQNRLANAAYSDTGTAAMGGRQAYWSYWALFYSRDIGPKPAAYEFQNFSTNQPKNSPSPLLSNTPGGYSNAPSGYVDPYHTYYYSNEYTDTKYSASNGYTPGTAVSGHVYDKNHNPIEGAVVGGRAINKILQDPISFEYSWDEVTNAYTFTDATGYYSLTPFNYLNITAGSRQWFWKVLASALGADNGDDGHNPWPPSSKKPSAVSGSNVDFTIKKIDLKLSDNSFQGQTVTGTVDKVARKTLFLANDVIEANAVADFHALDEVSVQNEFWAKAGSETHIYLAPSYTDCSGDFGSTGPFRLASPRSSQVFLNAGLLELNFIKSKDPEPFIALYPNPSTGMVNIEYIGKINVIKQVKVFDMLGNLVYSNSFATNSLTIDLSIVPKGVYTFQLKDPVKVFNNKLILQ